MSHTQPSSPAPLFFDRDYIKKIRNKCTSHIEDHNFLFNWGVQNLIDRLEVIKRNFEKTLFIGARQSPLTENQKSRLGSQILMMDIGKDMLERHSLPSITASEELLPIKQNSIDLILSPLCLHTTNDLPGSLIQINRALKPDGLFMGALFGPGTLQELRDCLMKAEIELAGGVSPRVMPFADKQQMGALLQRAQYNLPVIDSETVTVTYSGFSNLLNDIKGMGESNSATQKSTSIPPRDLFKKAEELYIKNYSDENGQLIATFDVIFCLGWSPHESQQKPMKPGTAKIRLSDALETNEISTGEKTGL